MGYNPVMVGNCHRKWIHRGNAPLWTLAPLAVAINGVNPPWRTGRPQPNVSSAITIAAKTRTTSIMTENNTIVAIFKSQVAAGSSLHQIMNHNLLTLSKLAALGATLALAAGCSTDNFYQNPPPRGTSNTSQSSMPVAAPPLPPRQTETVGTTAEGTHSAVSAQAGIRPAWNEDRTSLKAEKIYFAFDKATIRSRELSKLKDVADFMKRNAQISIRIEGNCDERGTEAFNRELRQCFA